MSDYVHMRFLKTTWCGEAGRLVTMAESQVTCPKCIDALAAAKSVTSRHELPKRKAP